MMFLFALCIIFWLIAEPLMGAGEMEKLNQAKSDAYETSLRQGKTVLKGITALTGFDLLPCQTQFQIPELADPYMTQLKNTTVISGTAPYSLLFRSVEDVARGGPYQIVWRDFYYADGTPMEGGRTSAHSWDMKPVPWVLSEADGSPTLRLWNPAQDKSDPLIIWYGGHMRPRENEKISYWPSDNFSRDVFAFVEEKPGQWVSRKNSIFAKRQDWPRAYGNFLGHRYGHQIVMTTKLENEKLKAVPTVFYEEVTEVRPDGSPSVTKIFSDEMISPFEAAGKPIELISPLDMASGTPYPRTIREDGSLLTEGPLYFRFQFENEDWEAIGFSAGSFYTDRKYPAAFASRKVADGLQGKPYLLDLSDDGSDLNDAGAELGHILNLAGGPGRPAVLVAFDGSALTDSLGHLQLLLHGYRKDILPDNDYSKFPVKYRLDQMFRVMLHATLQVTKSERGPLRFKIATPTDEKPRWQGIN